MEFKTEAIEVDDNLHAHLQKLAAEGWILKPGTKPVAIYHLCREAEPMPQATMTIDDSKVFVIRGGKAMPEGG